MSLSKELWKHFSKARCKTKVRCKYCSMYIAFTTDMVANCKKHLFRRHPSVYDGKVFGTYDPKEKRMLAERRAKAKQIKTLIQSIKVNTTELWKHFEKTECDTKALCKHCNKEIAYSETSSSNCKRHLYRKHPRVILNDAEYLVSAAPNEKKPEDGQETDAGTFVTAFNPSSNSSGTESNVREVQFVTNPYLSEPIRVEIQGAVSPQPHSSKGGENVTDARTSMSEDDFQSLSMGERITIKTSDDLISTDEQYLLDDASYKNEKSSTEIQTVQYITLSAEDLDIVDPICIDMNTDDEAGNAKQIKKYKAAKSAKLKIEALTKKEEKPQSPPNNRRDSARNIDVRTTVYATNVALEMKNLNSRQKIIAEKLISDVIYHAKLESLTEHALVLERVTTFDELP